MSDDLVHADKVTIVEGDPVSDFWLKGAVNRYPGYTFQAKVYDVGSVFGIEQGRISKLQVWRGDQSVMHYDRGWDEKPARRRDRKVLREILAGFRTGSGIKTMTERTFWSNGRAGALVSAKHVRQGGLETTTIMSADLLMVLRFLANAPSCATFIK
jgi:hypothetical protein